MTERPLLLTGAHGFIGRAVMAELARLDMPVHALDLGPPPAGLPANTRWIDASVTDAQALRQAMDGCGKVLHLAFMMDLEAEHAMASTTTNMLGTTRVFETARELGLERVVWASSVMVYGPRGAYADGPVDETDEPMPRTAYGAAKLALEWIARSYLRQGLETVGLRFTTVFGPGRQRLGAAGFCVELFEQAHRRLPLAVPQAARRANMLYIKDAVQACVRALEAPSPLQDIYNIGGFECSVGELAQGAARLAELPAPQSEPGGASPWPTDIAIDRARQDLAYKPHYLLSAACQDYLQALKSDN